MGFLVFLGGLGKRGLVIRGIKFSVWGLVGLEKMFDWKVVEMGKYKGEMELC